MHRTCAKNPLKILLKISLSYAIPVAIVELFRLTENGPIHLVI